METAPSTHGSNGRLSGGQFGPGNRFGKGNPRVSRLAANHQALLDCLTADEVAALTRRLYDSAMAGDNRAAEYLLNRLCGKPLEAVEPTEADEGGPGRVLLYTVCKSCGAAAEHISATAQEEMQVELQQPRFLGAESAKLADTAHEIG